MTTNANISGSIVITDIIDNLRYKIFLEKDIGEHVISRCFVDPETLVTKFKIHWRGTDIGVRSYSIVEDYAQLSRKYF